MRERPTAPGHGRRSAAVVVGSAKPPALVHRLTGREGAAWSVTDDLPRPVPVGRAELEALETFLGPALDALLRELKV